MNIVLYSTAIYHEHDLNAMSSMLCNNLKQITFLVNSMKGIPLHYLHLSKDSGWLNCSLFQFHFPLHSCLFYQTEVIKVQATGRRHDCLNGRISHRTNHFCSIMCCTFFFRPPFNWSQLLSNSLIKQYTNNLKSHDKITLQGHNKNRK